MTATDGTPDPTAGLLQRVCRAAIRALSASGSGVSVMTKDGTRGICAASDLRSERVEETQFVLGEGPGIDAYTRRCPVLTADLSDATLQSWPVYGPAAQHEGVCAVFAFPLQIGASRLGVLSIFRDRPGPLTGAELAAALRLADLTVGALLEGQSRCAVPGLSDGLDVDPLAQLFQAQGMVMVQLGVSIGDAMVRMRAFAYAEDRNLRHVAGEVVHRTLRFEPDPG